MIWSPQVQAAIISLITAAVVTVLVEWTVKPRLEARKERIMDAHRSRRDTLARLTLLREDVGHAERSITCGGDWETGLHELQLLCDESRQLAGSLKTFGALLGQRQREVAERALNNVVGHVKVLHDFLAALDKHAMPYVDVFSDNPENHMPFSERLDPAVEVFYSAAIAQAAIELKQWNRWSYHKRLQGLSQDLEPSLQ